MDGIIKFNSAIVVEALACRERVELAFRKKYNKGHF